MKKLLLSFAAGVVLAASAYLPPVEEKNGVRVEIESFPQKTERPAGDPYAWPLGVTEVVAAEQGPTVRAFPVVIENTTDKPVEGGLSVWLNADWTVKGPEGIYTLGPKEKKTLMFTATSKPSALSALYPVHARFDVGKGGDPAHPIAVFMFKNPKAPRALRPTSEPKLAPGVFRLTRGFARTCAVEVNGKTWPIGDDGASRDTGGHLLAERIRVDGQSKEGYRSHPPYRTGAGFIWADYPLDLPRESPIRFSCSNFLVDPGQAPASDGAEYKVFVLEEGKAPQEVASHIVKKILIWQDLSADLSPWAGRKITLRLWTGPGPKMITTCDGGGWGDIKLAIGPQPPVVSPASRAAFAKQAKANAKAAVTKGTDAMAGRWQLKADDGSVYGAAVVKGPRGLVDGALAFSDGKAEVVYDGFSVEIATGTEGRTPAPQADVSVEKGTLRIRWSLPGTVQDAFGFPRLEDIAVGPASVALKRVYAGFGNVIADPGEFTLGSGGFSLSTKHVGADYANGLSVVQAVDVVPDNLVCKGGDNLFALHAHHNATFTFVPSSKGAFEAARRFRGVAGYRKSPGHDTLGARMCLDQWGGDYRRAGDDLAKAAKYGLTDAIFVKHDWQRWGYDYRLPEIYPPRGNADDFGYMREACRAAGILFCPHDNYTDIYPDAENYSYDLVVFNLDGTPQRAWFNPGRHALSYRWAPHAFHPWALRNAKLLKNGYDPDAIFIDVLTAHGPFDYLDRQGRFHSKNETSASWAKGFQTYREGFRNPKTVCVSEAGQDHLVGVADAGQSDHFPAFRWMSPKQFGDSERTPWHDIVTHGYYVLFAGGLGGRYQAEHWNTNGDRPLHGYASDDYLSNTIIGGRNPMCDGPFSRDAVKTYWLQHDACAELAQAEFLSLDYAGDNIHRQHATFANGGEVWINRETNAVWRLAQPGVTLPPYGYYAKTKTTESGILEKNGVRFAFAKGPRATFVDARAPRRSFAAASAKTEGAETVSPSHVRVRLAWNMLRAEPAYRPFVHVCSQTDKQREGIVFQCGLSLSPGQFAKTGVYHPVIDMPVPAQTAAGTYDIWYGAWNPKGGARLALTGSRSDGSRLHAGTITVVRDATKITQVTWAPDAVPDRQAERDRVLGVNRAHAQVDFGGIVTDGSFRLVGDRIMPLPEADAFTATIDLAKFGWKGRTLARVEAIEPESDAQAPVATQTGGRVTLRVDAKAFAYRFVFK